MAQVRHMVVGATTPSLKVKLEERNSAGEWDVLQGLTGASVKFTMIEMVTHVSEDSLSSQTLLYVNDSTDLEANDLIVIGLGTKRSEEKTIQTINDNVVTLTGALTYSHTADDGDDIAVVKLNEATAVLEDADTGLIRYDWGASNLNETGTFLCQFKVTLADKNVLYVPTRFEDDLIVVVRGRF